MMTEDGPKVLEFNVRLGDPETQAFMHRLDDSADFGDVLMRSAVGESGWGEAAVEGGSFGDGGDGGGGISG